jgi:phage tail sheath protein FI
MATLVSAGVSVTVIDESFYIPASAPTVPLFFVATRKNKYQPNGVTPAAGTSEHSVVRTVTSIGQSTQLYGVPYFIKDSSGNEWHGDARNEYGLFALNQFLGIGNRAYVVRANVDLKDEATSFIAPYKTGSGSSRVTSLVVKDQIAVKTGSGSISSITASATNFKEERINVSFTSPTAFVVQGSESGIITTGTVGSAVSTSIVNFTISNGVTSFVAGDYFQFDLKNSPTSFSGAGNGTMNNLAVDVNAVPDTWTITFTSPTAFTVENADLSQSTTGAVGSVFDNNFINFTIVAGSAAFAVGDTFRVSLASITPAAPLGANDAAKRVAIATALQAQINSNQEVRSEIYEYNLIVCPGYPEVVDEMVALSATVNDEAFVLGDVPVSKTPDQAAVWALTTERAKSTSVAYYYPWGLASNLDGRNVCVAPSGIALRTYAYSDNQSYVWFAPAGVRRGTVTGVSSVGYVSGELGTATTFVETNLNQGQRDNLYEFFKNINPIVSFPQQGLIIWGQKTSATAASALDRVNAMRLVMYIKRQLRKGAFPFVFEPNDKITRDNLKAMADAFLNDILAKRGLYDFVTLCDESNNTPDRIDRNEMYLDVALKPVKAAEFIYIPIRVLSTGAQMPG